MTSNLKTKVSKFVAQAYLFLILENTQLELLLFQFLLFSFLSLIYILFAFARQGDADCRKLLLDYK